MRPDESRGGSVNGFSGSAGRITVSMVGFGTAT